MRYDNEVKLENVEKPRARFSYAGIDTHTRLIKNPMADDFQQEIKDNFLVAVHDDSKYPVSGKISLYIELTTSRSVHLLGVAKNIMDACIGIIYSDDSVVESILINRNAQEKGLLDHLVIKVVNGKPLRSNELTYDNINDYTLLNIELNTLVEDNYMPYPPSIVFKELINPNDDEALKAQLEIACKSAKVSSRTKVLSITVAADDSKVDVDNLCLNYIVNLIGIAYSELEQIDSLHLLKTVNSTRNQVIIRFSRS